MAIDLHRPSRVRVGVRSEARRPGRSIAAVAIPVVLRGLTVGVGVGILLATGAHAGPASIAALGVLALGAALLSWDR
jgi:F0F1-type ATP synthase assembly protein I